MVEDFGKRALSGRVHHVIKYVNYTPDSPRILYIHSLNTGLLKPQQIRP